jgi:hypothetical protein
LEVPVPRNVSSTIEEDRFIRRGRSIQASK